MRRQYGKFHGVLEYGCAHTLWIDQIRKGGDESVTLERPGSVCYGLWCEAKAADQSNMRNQHGGTDRPRGSLSHTSTDWKNIQGKNNDNGFYLE